MLQPLLVGLGRSGVGLHLRTLRKLAHRPVPLVRLPAVGCDPRAADLALDSPDLLVVPTLEDARSRLDPTDTVVHLCTPPGRRLPALRTLAELGFRRVLVEKPLAADRDELDALVRLREEAALHLVVVAHWTTSQLAARLRALVRSHGLGTLRGITIDQHKPRFARSLANHGHPSALDVEIPHGLGLALDLAGPADLHTAHCWDLRCPDRTLPRLGGARVELRHHNGVLTRLRSDLGAPVRQRSVVCAFDHGTATAHFPLSEDDHHAQLVLDPGPTAGEGAAGADHHVLHDDALTDFLAHAYRAFRSPGATGPSPASGPRTDFPAAHDAARLLCEAKERCATPHDPTGTHD
ncbi:hypothetical protein [Streptomyces sp. NPDC002490]|uniref:hypothetical protein n=1 Tax=Streptomyces sp. NPDC002490 TaxID=3154416 RepID=UPI00331ECF25